MNPIRIFLLIFAGGLLLAVGLGIYGMQQDPGMVADEDMNEELNGEMENGEAVGEHPDFIVQNCLSCHGNDLEGGPAAPGLLDIDLSEDEIVDILVNGEGAMPGGLIPGQEEEAAQYLLEIQGQ